MTRSTKKQKGFTLIELIVAIAIVGLFSSVVLAGLAKAREDAKNGQVRAQRHEFSIALQLFFEDHGYYPDPKLLGGTPIYINGVPYYALCLGVASTAATDCVYNDIPINASLAKAESQTGLSSMASAGVLAGYIGWDATTKLSDHIIADHRYKGSAYFCANPVESQNGGCPTDKDAITITVFYGGPEVCGKNSTALLTDGASTLCAQKVMDESPATIDTYYMY